MGIEDFNPPLKESTDAGTNGLGAPSAVNEDADPSTDDAPVEDVAPEDAPVELANEPVPLAPFGPDELGPEKAAQAAADEAATTPLVFNNADPDPAVDLDREAKIAVDMASWKKCQAELQRKADITSARGYVGGEA